MKECQVVISLEIKRRIQKYLILKEETRKPFSFETGGVKEQENTLPPLKN